MMSDLKDDFLKKLVSCYGDWETHSSRFGTFSYGEIADELCISGSQFSKLLYGSATDGMYERTLKNIDGLQERKRLGADNRRLNNEVNLLRTKLSETSSQSSVKYRYLLLLSFICFVSGYVFHSFFMTDQAEPQLSQLDNKSHFLGQFFDREFNSDFVSPFLNINEVQNYCPASAFEGTWELDKEYVIPVPMRKPGLYYLAKESELKMKCLRSVPLEDRGKVLAGFEYMKHELWIDTNRDPLSPKYFNITSKNYTKDFFNIDFEGDPAFKKLATIYSFMYNKFEIKDNQIVRTGEPSGRYAEDVDHELAEEYQIDVKSVLENNIGNLVQTVCDPFLNTYCNPNTIVEKESVISFKCDFTIKNENLGIGGSYPYVKGFRIVKQNYSENLLCDCNN